MIYYEYAINYRLSCLLTISTCILFWNPAGWNVTYVLLEPLGFTSGLFEVDGAWDVVAAEDANRKKRYQCQLYQDSQAFESCFFDQAFLRSRMRTSNSENLWWNCDAPIGRGAQQESWKLCAKMVEIPFRVWDPVLLEICGTSCGERKRHVFDRGGICWDHVALKDSVLPCLFAAVVWSVRRHHHYLDLCSCWNKAYALGDPKIVPSREVPKRFGEMPWFAIGRKRNAIRSVCVLDGGWLL